MSYKVVFDDELYHHGILGMKWGVRRYQNEDGSLTEAGKKRYEKEMAKAKRKGTQVKSVQDWVKDDRKKTAVAVAGTAVAAAGIIDAVYGGPVSSFIKSKFVDKGREVTENEAARGFVEAVNANRKPVRWTVLDSGKEYALFDQRLEELPDARPHGVNSIAQPDGSRLWMYSINELKDMHYLPEDYDYTWRP